MGTSFVSYTGAAGGGFDPIGPGNVDYWWPLSASFASTGNSEPSIGGFTTPLTVTGSVSGSQSVSLLNTGTASAYVASATDAKWTAPIDATTLASTFTIGVFFRNDRTSPALLYTNYIFSTFNSANANRHGVSLERVNNDNFYVTFWGGALSGIRRFTCTKPSSPSPPANSDPEVKTSLYALTVDPTKTVPTTADFKLNIDGVDCTAVLLTATLATVSWSINSVGLRAQSNGASTIGSFEARTDGFHQGFFVKRGSVSAAQLLNLRNQEVTVDSNFYNILFMSNIEHKRGGESASDWSIYKNTIQTTGLTNSVDAKYGSGSKLISTSGYIFISGSSNTATEPLFNFIANNFTIEMWIKPTSVSGIRQLFTRKVNSSGTDFKYQNWEINNGVLVYQATFNGSTYGVNLNSGATLIQANVWQHICVQRMDESGMFRYAMFIDGVRVAEFDDSLQTPYFDPPVCLTGFLGTSSNPYVGYFDEIRVTRLSQRYSRDGFTVPPKHPLTY